MTTSSNLRPMEFGEVYTRAFGLLGRIGGVALLALVLCIGSGYLMNVVGLDAQESQLAMLDELGQGGGEPSQAAAGAAMMAGIMALGVMIVYIGVVVFASVMLMMAAWEALNDRPASPGELLGHVLRRAYWAVLVQCIIVGVILVLYALLLVLIGTIAGAGDQKVLTVVMLVGVAPLLYPLMLVAFAPYRTAIDGRGPWQGIIASIALVKGQWMRAFALFAVALIALIAVNILVSSLADLPRMGFNIGAPGDYREQARMLREMIANQTPMKLLVGAVMQSVGSVIMTVIVLVIYADLRARRGEFDEVAGEDGADLLQ